MCGSVNQKLIIRRRVIQVADLELIRQLIVTEGAQGRSHLSNRLCELWDWRQANGRYRQIACRDLLRRLEAKGLIQLPAPQRAMRPVCLTCGTRSPWPGRWPSSWFRWRCAWCRTPPKREPTPG